MHGLRQTAARGVVLPPRLPQARRVQRDRRSESTGKSVGSRSNLRCVRPARRSCGERPALRRASAGAARFSHFSRLTLPRTPSYDTLRGRGIAFHIPSGFSGPVPSCIRKKGRTGRFPGGWNAVSPTSSCPSVLTTHDYSGRETGGDPSNGFHSLPPVPRPGRPPDRNVNTVRANLIRFRVDIEPSGGVARSRAPLGPARFRIFFCASPSADATRLAEAAA